MERQGQDCEATAGEERMRGHYVRVLGVLWHHLTINSILYRGVYLSETNTRHCVARVGVADAPAPTPTRGHAMRTDSGRPSSSMRLSAWTPTLTSVTRRRSVRACSPSPITRLYREMAASARARAL